MVRGVGGWGGGYKKKGGGLAGAGERFSMSHCMSVTSFLMENEAIINYFYWQPEQNIYHVGCLLAVVGEGGG